MTIKLGITGGIGSGKSTICRIFKMLGTPVFEADLVAKNLMNTNPEIIDGLIHLFGKEIYSANNILNRKKLAEIIFNNNTSLEKVNQLVHPAVRKEFERWAQSKNESYIIHEAAILFESGFYKMMDYTLLITAPEKLRIERVIKRDGLDTKVIKERMAKQWSDSEKRKLASIEIANDNIDLIIPQIIKIDENLKINGKIW